MSKLNFIHRATKLRIGEIKNVSKSKQQIKKYKEEIISIDNSKYKNNPLDYYIELLNRNHTIHQML